MLTFALVFFSRPVPILRVWGLGQKEEKKEAKNNITGHTGFFHALGLGAEGRRNKRIRRHKAERQRDGETERRRHRSNWKERGGDRGKDRGRARERERERE